MSQKAIPSEALVDLRRRLVPFPPRSAERRGIMRETAALYGVSEATLYRALRERARPRALHRADHGHPRFLPKDQMERYCEVIAAIKLRTSNKQGRHLSTAEAIRLLEAYGIDTPDGPVRAPPGVLKKPTVNRYLKRGGYDRETLLRPPPAVRFQARDSNDCWHFDLSPSDLKQVKAPAWFQEGRGHPLLMLYSVVDDRSGVAYQEYHGVYGEDVEAALRFLFAAMAPKAHAECPFQGRPLMLYMDNGPIARSLVFQQVLRYLDIELRTHMPQSTASRHATARAKGKVERPFRTVKEMHETLSHFHEPETEAEANAWLLQFLLCYNSMQHRTEPHSRLDDWLEHLPPGGIRAMCDWDRFCTFAREPERRKVSIDARVAVGGVAYQVDPNLAGETVVLWWGLLDQELYVEHGEHRYGPYHALGGPIPLHRYRRFKKTVTEQRAERIDALATQLVLPRTALTGLPPEAHPTVVAAPALQPFVDPDPFQEFAYPTRVAAKLAIADYLAFPLAKLPPGQLEAIESLLSQTLRKHDVLEYVRTQIQPTLRRSPPCSGM
jgi:hypothetical protein